MLLLLTFPSAEKPSDADAPLGPDEIKRFLPGGLLTSEASDSHRPAIAIGATDDKACRSTQPVS